MAGKKKRKGKKAAHGSAGRVLGRLLLTAAALLLAVMTVWGSFVTLECTDLSLRDLPSAFDYPLQKKRHKLEYMRTIADDVGAQRVQAGDGRRDVGGEIVAADRRFMLGERRSDEQSVRL